MKPKDLIEELSKLPEDIDILCLEDDNWQAKLTWNNPEYKYIYSDDSKAIILFIRKYD